MIGSFAAMAMAGYEHAQAEHRAFEASIAELPVAQQEERRRLRQEARHHRERMDAERERTEALRGRNRGLFGFILGVIVGSAGD